MATSRGSLGGVAEPQVDIRAYLEGLEQERLVELVLELAQDDELALARLSVAAAAATASDAPPLRGFLDAIDSAFAIDDYVPYREAHGYAWRIREAVAALEGLLDDGQAEAAIGLCEHALEQAESAVDLVDDSDGFLGDIVTELQELHLAACERACPDPVALAERLFELECRPGSFEVFLGAAATYAEVLGESGLAAYRRLAEATWERLPALGPGEKGSHGGDRFRIASMMEALAETSGEVDAVVAVLAKDQSSPYQFVRIVERYRLAGRFADALAWAERGVEQFGPSADHRLLEAAAEEYQRAGRGERAVELAWRAFEERPTPAGYERLRAQATRAGAWESWRPPAFERLREAVTSRIEAAETSRQGTTLARWGIAPDGSDLVQVLLLEGDVEQAWVEAKAGGCSRNLWLELAHRRERDHPLEAIPVYAEEIERLIDVKNNSAYRQAVETMARVAELMRAAGQPDAFRHYAVDVRVRHKSKRNLVKLLDARGW